MRLLRLFLLVIGTYTSFPAVAQDAASPKFALPLACTYGKNCWVMNYADVGPDGDGKATDPACFQRTYEAHKGTDFAIADERAMKEGINVLAARGGKIARARDGETDQWANAATLKKIREASKDCGNAVLIDHGDGWQTMYCHMKQKSIPVKAGQTVKAGDKIGQVGLSGYTQSPHLHFGLTHNGKIIDPFTGASLDQPCGTKGESLWDEASKILYEPLTIYRDGFDTKEPSLRLLDLGEKQKMELIASHSPSVVYYAVFYGARENDQIKLTILDPDGKIFAESSKHQEATRARQMLYVGRKTDQILPRRGKYKGIIEITRIDTAGEKQIFTKQSVIDVK